MTIKIMLCLLELGLATRSCPSASVGQGHDSPSKPYVESGGKNLIENLFFIFGERRVKAIVTSLITGNV